MFDLFLVIWQMSLFIGKLSKHTRRDELECVFRMFGHCNVQLKNGGYGFAVFDFPADAAKALRELKGENICGNRLNLTWSSKQPTRNFQTLGRGGRNSQHARNSDRSYRTRKVYFNGRRNRKMDNDGRIESFDGPGKERDHRHDDITDCVGEQKDHKGLSDKGGGAVPTPRDKLDNEDYHVGHCSGSHGVNVQKNMRRAQGGQDNSVEVENKSGPGSCVKQQSSGDALLLWHWRDERSISGSQQSHAPLRNESLPMTKETDRPQGKEYGGMK
ncbi:putative RNA recognition motif domain-containing protein [Lupinus albus]|uniref:Putative RNA recognition motif domain-containing protein n=1 Tax=Lupinus albus TaxID=3870 RepID=A0A6A4R2H8_LUPAL|nr:putative RNA recognition motif domain-containing protein [Lupinus albus]